MLGTVSLVLRLPARSGLLALCLVLFSSCGGGDSRSSSALPSLTADDPDLGEFLTLVNEFRATTQDCGGTLYSAARSLSYSPTLIRAAEGHSLEMANRNVLDHGGIDGSRFTDRAREAGYTGCPRGENIAYHTGKEMNASRVFSQWSNSAGHCRVLMGASANEVGLGYAFGLSPGGYPAVYYTLVTGSSDCD